MLLSRSLRKTPGAARFRARSPQAATYPTDAEIVGTHDTVTNFAKEANILSVKTGDWSDPTTWSLNRVPAQDDIVGIKTTHTVTYDVSSVDLLLAIGVAGKLAWATNVNTLLGVQTICVYDGGELEIGTSAAPIDADKTAEIIWGNSVLIDQNTGGVTNKEFSNGLLVFSGGKLRVHGAIKTPYVRAAAAVASSATTLSFDTQSGWRNSDRVLIPDTRQYFDSDNLPFRDEVRTISSVASTSATVSAMTHTHPVGVDKDNVTEFTPHIANLTRNVIFRSEDADGIRGHAICFGRCNVDVRYARFDSMGRTLNASLPNTTTNQKGRYPWHWHHVYGPVAGLGYDAAVDSPEFDPVNVLNTREADGPSGRLIGCVFEDLAIDAPDMKWPITLHETSDCLIKNNICYKGSGSLMMFEDGTECYNVIDGNFLCTCPGTGDRGDLSFSDGAPGREGNGISMPNCTNYVRNNVAYNIGQSTPSGVAYHVYGGKSTGGFEESDYLTQKLAAFQGADPSVNYTTSAVYPILEFKDNEACCCFQAFVPWYIGSTVSTVSASIAYSVLDNFNVWHCREVSYNFPCQKLKYLGGKWRGDAGAFVSATQGCAGITRVDYMQTGMVVDGVDIQMMKAGIFVTTKIGQDGLLDIRNCILHNYFNIYSETPNAVAGGGSGLPARTTQVTDCTMTIPVDGGFGQAPKHLRLDFMALNDRPNINWIQTDIYRFTGCDGDETVADSKFHWTQSAGAFITPQTSGNNIGSPDAGQTNTQNLAEHGVCIAGSIWAGTATRTGFDGYEETL